jgi:hypothetical protein
VAAAHGDGIAWPGKPLPVLRCCHIEAEELSVQPRGVSLSRCVSQDMADLLTSLF